MSARGDRRRSSGPASCWLRVATLALVATTSLGRSVGRGDGAEFGALSSSPAPATFQRKTLGQEIGSPSELAWQAWLLVENKGGGQSALDSSNILRRITPKSIFIAPELVSCPPGYSSDGKGVCKPDPIKIDEDAQRQFFLKRLNALYGKLGGGRKKPEVVTGPLQINIPISLQGKPPEPQKQPEPVTDKAQGSRFSVAIPQQPAVEPTDKGQDTVAVVLYKVVNDTKREKNKEEAPFFLGGSSAPKKHDTQTERVVPVVEIADVTNDKFAGVVDYKIPIGHNQTGNRNATKSHDGGQPPEKKVDSSEDSSPTMVLLVSSTKAPLATFPVATVSETSRPIVTHKWLGERVSKLSDSTTELPSSDEDDVKFQRDTTIQTVAPLGAQTTVDWFETTFATTTEKSYTQDRLETDEPVYVDDETHAEEYDETTTDEIESEDEFGESEDELLKAGEAGMMVSSKGQDHVRTKHHKQSTLPDTEGTTTFAETTTVPTLPTFGMRDSTGFVGDSTIKTESTDFAREDAMTTQTTEVPSTIFTTTEPAVEDTTFFSTRPQRVHSFLKATTRTISTTQAPVTANTETYKTEPQDFFKTDIVTEPEVLYSTQDSNGFTTFYNHRKPPTHPSRIVETPYTFDVLEDIIPKTEPPSFPDFLRQHPPADSRRQKPSITINDRPILFKDEDDIPSEFRDQFSESSRPFSSDFRRVPHNDATAYVRFPDQSADSRSRDYIRFPSDEVNSIHNQDAYKDLLTPYRSRDELNSPTSTKSSVPVRQKPPSTFWRVPPPGQAGARTDRQQPANSRQKNQKPMLLKFWARMPLVRDLSFYPTTSHGSHNEPIGGQAEVARRPRLSFKETHDVNRLLAQQLGQSGIGG